jgi:phospholipid transport system substrate-binding protein
VLSRSSRGRRPEAKGLSFEQRYQRLAPAIGVTYNRPLMSQLSVRAEWARLQPAQQRHLIEAFSRYTIAIYANRFDSYNGQRSDVDPATATNPNGVIVQTKLTRVDGTKLALNYLMRQSGGSGPWQAIDVYMNGTISELATRRADFVAVLQRSSVDGCCNSLRLAPVICAGINLNPWEQREDIVRVLPPLTAPQAE